MAALLLFLDIGNGTGHPLDLFGELTDEAPRAALAQLIVPTTISTSFCSLITDDSAEEAMPCFSPDGKYLFFASYSEGIGSIVRIELSSMSKDTVLVLLDDQEKSVKISKYLKDAGFKSAVASNLADAEKLISGEDIDLVITDDKVGVTKRFMHIGIIRSLTAAPVIIYSAKAEKRG